MKDRQNIYTSNKIHQEANSVPAMERKFERHLDSLSKIFDFIEQFTHKEKIDDQSKHSIDLAVDELFTNMVKYHPDNPNHISITARVDGEVMTLEIVDHDVDSFDPTKMPDPDLSASLEKREPGGLGIFLTKEVVDDIQYHYSDRTSRIILKKNFRRTNV